MLLHIFVSSREGIPQRLVRALRCTNFFVCHRFQLSAHLRTCLRTGVGQAQLSRGSRNCPQRNNMKRYFLDLIIQWIRREYCGMRSITRITVFSGEHREPISATMQSVAFHVGRGRQEEDDLEEERRSGGVLNRSCATTDHSRTTAHGELSLPVVPQ